MSLDKYKFNWCIGQNVPEEFIPKLAELFSNHYGKWSSKSKKNSGEQIKHSPAMIRRYLSPEDSQLWYALYQEKIIGYAIVVNTSLRKKNGTKGKEIVSWITQLVIHGDHRHKGVAQHLLNSIWRSPPRYACGLLTASPYGIRALEWATSRRCQPSIIKKYYKKLLKIAYEDIWYVSNDMSVEITDDVSRINTEFFVDHTQIPSRLRDVSQRTPWLLGPLEEGWEWFAFTFQEQEPFTNDIEK